MGEFLAGFVLAVFIGFVILRAIKSRKEREAPGEGTTTPYRPDRGDKIHER